MPPVVLPDDMMSPDEYITDETDIDDHVKNGLNKSAVRRDSTGSTGYSTCSSNLRLSSISSYHYKR